MKKLHSLIATLLAVSMILTMFTGVFTVNAATVYDTAETWNGTIATEFAGGDGTQANPFRIENGAQLAKAVIDKGLKDNALAYYIITNDIYLNDDYANYKNWATTAPANNWGVTYSGNAFAGHLDGGYHTIYGMYYSQSGSYAGLVAYLSGTGAAIRNLTIANSYIKNTSGNSTALFAGRIDNGTIANCLARDSYITSSDNHTMAGIAAWSNTSTTKITNCAAYGLTFTSTNTIGGILAKSNNGNASVRFCFSGGVYLFGNTGSISVRTSDSDTSRCYTDVKGPSGGKYGVLERVNSTDPSIKGADALTLGMPRIEESGLWKTTDSYPTLVGNGTKGEVWSGTKAAWFAGGDGTSAHPFLIETGEQLYKAIADNGMMGTAAHYLITADIYLNKDYADYLNWGTTAPAKNWGVTYTSGSFAGYLDGGYHTIYGMYNNTQGSFAGLIPYMSGSSATVCNLTITNSYVYSSIDSTAVLVGRLDRGIVSKCIVHDAYVSNKNKTVMAGVVAYTNSDTDYIAKIQNCGAYNLTFDANDRVFGGVLGKSAKKITKVENSYSSGTHLLGFISDSLKYDRISCANCYTDIDQEWKGEVTDNNPDILKGTGAVANMKLSTSIWKDTETYPAFILNNGTEGEVWTGDKANSFIGGTGTEEDPYLIATAEQLYKAVKDLGKKSDGTAAHYLITTDIYLNKNYANYADWATTAPANNWGTSNSGSSFAGSLDGGFHTIYGMYNSASGSYVGLVAYLSGTGSKICNLTIANSYANNTSSNSTALFAGRIDNGTIDRCIARDSYITNKDNKTMAGIAAWSNTNTTVITNCGAYGLTFTSTNTVGGILAQSNNGNATVKYCYSAGTYIFGNTSNISCTYSYTDVAHDWKNGVSNKSETPEVMKGTAAANGMIYLDFNTVWQTVENGYPILRKPTDNNLNQKINASYSVKSGGNAWVIFTSKVVMPEISPANQGNIAITVDGVKNTVSEVGVIISRAGVDVTDIGTVTNNPLTGYKIIGYTNGSDNTSVITAGGQVEITAIVNGNADYTAKTYIKFADDTVVYGDVYDAEPSTDAITVDTGIEVNDVYANGDANFDGEVDLKDMVRIKKYAVLGSEFNANAVLDIVDTDGDSAFAATDFVGLGKVILNSEKKNYESEMKLVFEDNFDTLSLDKSKWDFTNYMTGYGVDTVETSDVQSIQREEDGNGYLHLTSYKATDGSYKATKSISTGNKLTFVHGYLEIRAKVPTVQGAWPSLWLKSNTKNTNLGWSSDFPYNTEVDVFEVMGGNKAISELHKWQYVAETGVTNDIRYSSKKNRNSYAITDNDWHTYGMLWTNDEITMYVDGVAIQTYNLNKDYEVKWPWDKGIGMDGFKNQPLCITLNNCLFTPEYTSSSAGSWASSYVVGNDFTESVYDIDYVRLYQDETDTTAKLYKAE